MAVQQRLKTKAVPPQLVQTAMLVASGEQLALHLHEHQRSAPPPTRLWKTRWTA